MREEEEEVRKHAGVENGTDAGIEAAGEAADGSGGLNEEIGVVVMGGELGRLSLG